jgi:hypothetical protein
MLRECGKHSLKAGLALAASTPPSGGTEASSRVN